MLKDLHSFLSHNETYDAKHVSLSSSQEKAQCLASHTLAPWPFMACGFRPTHTVTFFDLDFYYFSRHDFVTTYLSLLFSFIICDLCHCLGHWIFMAKD